MSPELGPSPSHHVPVEWLRPGRCTSLQFQRGSAQAKRLVPSQGCPGRSGRGRTQGSPTRETRTRWPGDRGRPAPPRASPGTGQRAPGGAAAASRGHRGRGPSVRPSPRARPCPPQLSPASAPTAARSPLTSPAAATAAAAAAAVAATTRSRDTSLRPVLTLLPPERGGRGARPGRSRYRRADSGWFTPCFSSHPASARAPNPESESPGARPLSPRSHLAGPERMRSRAADLGAPWLLLKLWPRPQ